MTQRLEAELVVTLEPQSLRLPVDTHALQQSLEQLGEVVDVLERSAASLDEAAGEEDVRGKTATALQRACRFSRGTARRNRRMLEDVREGLTELLQTSNEVEGQIDDLRVRWENAREELRTDAKDLDVERPLRLARSIDRELAEDHRRLLKVVLGIDLDLGGPAGSFLAASEVNEAERQYRQTVRAVLEELVEGIRRVRRAQRRVRESMSWERRERVPDDDQPDRAHATEADGVSGARAMRPMVRALEEGADALSQADGQLGRIARRIEAGMLPRAEDPDDQGPDPGTFGDLWDEHLARRIRRMRRLTEAGQSMVREVSRIDEETATELTGEPDD